MTFVLGILFLVGVAFIGYGANHHAMATVVGGVIAAVCGFVGLLASSRRSGSRRPL